MNQSRSGLKTTEFWLTSVKALIGPLLAIFVTTGILVPGQVAEAEVAAHLDQIILGVIALGGLFVSGGAVRTYTEARTGVKQIEIQAAAQAGAESEPIIGFQTVEGEEDDEEVDDEYEPGIHLSR